MKRIFYLLSTISKRKKSLFYEAKANISQIKHKVENLMIKVNKKDVEKKKIDNEKPLKIK